MDWPEGGRNRKKILKHLGNLELDLPTAVSH